MNIDRGADVDSKRKLADNMWAMRRVHPIKFVAMLTVEPLMGTFAVYIKPDWKPLWDASWYYRNVFDPRRYDLYHFVRNEQVILENIDGVAECAYGKIQAVTPKSAARMLIRNATVWSR